MSKYIIPHLPLSYDLETKTILKQVNKSNQKLAELKGVARTIPNENILISSLTLQEAKDSSAVENIVTTQDDLYKAGLEDKITNINAATKEVLRYREAITEGFSYVRNKHVLTNNAIKDIQQSLVNNNEGFRKVPGTKLKDSNGNVIYTPPQDINDIDTYMNNLELFINDDSLCDFDPLIKMMLRLYGGELFADLASFKQWLHRRASFEQMIFKFNNVQKRRR